MLASGDEEALVRRLVDESAMTEEAAWWAVKSWVMALEMPVLAVVVEKKEDGLDGVIAKSSAWRNRVQTKLAKGLSTEESDFSVHVRRSKFLDRLESVRAAHAAHLEAIETYLGFPILLILNGMVMLLLDLIIGAVCVEVLHAPWLIGLVLAANVAGMIAVYKRLNANRAALIACAKGRLQAEIQEAVADLSQFDPSLRAQEVLGDAKAK